MEREQIPRCFVFEFGAHIHRGCDVKQDVNLHTKLYLEL